MTKLRPGHVSEIIVEWLEKDFCEKVKYRKDCDWCAVSLKGYSSDEAIKRKIDDYFKVNISTKKVYDETIKLIPKGNFIAGIFIGKRTKVYVTDSWLFFFVGTGKLFKDMIKKRHLFNLYRFWEKKEKPSIEVDDMHLFVYDSTLAWSLSDL